MKLNTPSERSVISPKEGERTHTDIVELPEISTFTQNNISITTLERDKRTDLRNYLSVLKKNLLANDFTVAKNWAEVRTRFKKSNNVQLLSDDLSRNKTDMHSMQLKSQMSSTHEEGWLRDSRAKLASQHISNNYKSPQPRRPSPIRKIDVDSKFKQETFNMLNTQYQNSLEGLKYVKSPRKGAGSLGPNFKQKIKKFLPIILNTESKINKRDEIKQKIEERTMKEDDWKRIGSDRILTITVLDDIFKKYNDYKALTKQHRTQNISDTSGLLNPEVIEESFSSSESDSHLDRNKKFSPSP